MEQQKPAAFQRTWSQEQESSQKGRGFTSKGPIPWYLRKASRAGPAMFNREFKWSREFMVMRQVQGEARKATHQSGSGPARLTRVRPSPMITGQL